MEYTCSEVAGLILVLTAVHIVHEFHITQFARHGSAEEETFMHTCCRTGRGNHLHLYAVETIGQQTYIQGPIHHTAACGHTFLLEQFSVHVAQAAQATHSFRLRDLDEHSGCRLTEVTVHASQQMQDMESVLFATHIQHHHTAGTLSALDIVTVVVGPVIICGLCPVVCRLQEISAQWGCCILFVIKKDVV